MKSHLSPPRHSLASSWRQQVPLLVATGFALLIALGLATNLYLWRELKETAAEARRIDAVADSLGTSIQTVRLHFVTMGLGFSDLLLDPSTSDLLQKRGDTQARLDGDADERLELALQSTGNESLRRVLRDLQAFDKAVCDPSEDDLLAAAKVDPAAAREIYLTQFLPAFDKILAYAEEAQQMGNDEIATMKAASAAALAEAQTLSRLAIGLFLFIGLTSAIALSWVVRGLVRQAAEGARLNRDMMDHSLDVICSIDAEGRFANVNDACEKTWGYRAQELTGRAFLDFVYPEDIAKTKEASAEVVGGEPIKDFENRYVRKDGVVIDMMWSARWSDQEKMMFCVAHDNTERRRASEDLRNAVEAAEAASRAKGEFLANMSHEIRTPLNGIIGMTELALDLELSRELRDYLGMVQTSGHTLLNLLNDILDFSKIEAGMLTLESIEFSLRDCVGKTLEALAVRAHQKGLELSVSIAPVLPDLLIGDPSRLRQIIVNLVDNAIKFSQAGGQIVVEVESQAQDDREICLHFSISDTGLGIPKDKQKLIFEAFVQADGSTTRHHGGTGLGLGICTRLVHLMQGTISVESTLGEGSTFHFTARFPLRIPPVKLEIPANFRGLRVLVVDDHEVNRRIFKEILLNWQMVPYLASSADEAMQEVEREMSAERPFDFVLMDAMMPGVDGFTLSAQLRNAPRPVRAPIVILSSGFRAGDRERGETAGISSLLMKPVRPSELMIAIQTALKEKAATFVVKDPEPELVKVPVADTVAKRSLRILIAEDNPVNQAVAKGMLEKEGHILSVVGNGREAVGLYEQRPFDLILMDVQMPELDGLGATGEIRAAEVISGRRTPIIAMTAYALSGDSERCLKAGMDAYLSKPLSKKLLLKTIASLTSDSAKQPNEETSTFTAGAFNREALLRNLGGDEDLFHRVTELFIANTPRQMGDIRRAIAQRDGRALEKTAHVLLSTLGIFGAERAKDIAMNLQVAGQLQNFDDADDRFAELEDETERLSAAIGFARSKEHEPVHS